MKTKIKKRYRMEQYIILLIVVIMLAACGKAKVEKEVTVSAQERFTAEKLLAEDINFCTKSSWIQGTNIYAVGTSKIFHEVQLLKYDIEGQQLSKTVLDTGENNIGNASQAYVDEKGQLHVFCYYLNEGESEIAGYRYCIFDLDGSIVKEADYTDVVRPFLKSLIFPSGLVILPDGRLLFAVRDDKMNTTMMLLSDSGEILFQKNLGKTEVQSLIRKENGKVFSLERKIKHEALYTIGEIDLTTGERKELVSDLPKASTIKLVESMNPELFYCVTDNGIWEIDEKGSRMLISLDDISLSSAYDVSTACQLSDGSWRLLAIVNREAGEYNYFDYNVLRLVNAYEELDQKKELSLAVLSDYAGLYKSDIIDFNKTRNDAKIVLKEYESIDLLIADLTAGIVPDLLDLAEGEMFDLLERKGLLEDLGKYLSSESEISKEDFSSKCLEFYSKNEKIYSIPYGMAIFAMMGNKKYLGDREGWNLEEYKDFIASLPNQAMATKGIAKQEMLRILCIQYMDEFVNKKKGECHFKTKRFDDMLEFVNYYPDHGSNVNEIAELFEEIQSGDIILIPVTFQEVSSYELYRSLFPEEIQIIGYPMKDKNGISLIPIGKTPAMLSNGANKEIAWEFLKYVMTHKTTGFNVFYSYRPFYDEIITEAMENANAKESTTEIAMSGLKIQVPHASLQEIEVLEKMLSDGNVTGSSDDAIIKIISEEADAYFSGIKTIEQVEEIIQNRVMLYITE